MSKTKWEVRQSKDRTLHVAEGKVLIARVCGSTAIGDQRKVFIERAALIAAAPDLLQACRDTLDALYHAEGDAIEEIRVQLRKAIAAAEGRSA